MDKTLEKIFKKYQRDSEEQTKQKKKQKGTLTLYHLIIKFMLQSRATSYLCSYKPLTEALGSIRKRAL